jgi:hypothetical protein
MGYEFTKAALYWIKTFNKKVKEKIWMGKLVELLNEYETPRSWIVFKSYDDYDWTFYWVDCDWETEVAWSDSYICGKRFWWVEWLVENDKINLDKLEKKVLKENLIRKFDEWLLMLLSISDTPIEDLILYLK